MSALLALIAAAFGVTGTLLAPVLAQRSQAKALAEDFERQQQAAEIQWQRERVRTEFEKRRTSYAATIAAMRRYRVQLMLYLWAVHRGDVDDALRVELEAARHGHHAAFAEVQMIASDSVLDHLDQMARALADGYGRTKDLEEGRARPGGAFEDIEEHLHGIIEERWQVMRNAMRADLGVSTASASRDETG
ncbi:hypothetical protein [Streptomyces sp. NPDC003514]